MGKIVMSENVSLDGVIQDPAGDEGFRRRRLGRPDRGPPASSAKLALDEALGAEALLLGRRSYEWLRRAVAIPERRAGGQVEQPAQVRRVLDPRRSRLEQLDGTEGRRGRTRSRS